MYEMKALLKLEYSYFIQNIKFIYAEKSFKLLPFETMNRLMSSGSAKNRELYVIKPLEYPFFSISRKDLPWSSHRYTFLFTITKDKASAGSWDCKNEISSP